MLAVRSCEVSFHLFQALIDKILEVIPVAELAIQREIISCIPEVVEDAKHGEIAVLIK